jgi:hypothetical protein
LSPGFVNPNSEGHSRKVLRKLREYQKAEIYNMMVRCEKQETIAQRTGLSQSYISTVINQIREESKRNLKQFLATNLVHAHTISMAGVDAVIAECWNTISAGGSDMRVSDKTNLLSLLAGAYEQRLSMAADGELVGEALTQMEMIKEELLALSGGSPEQIALIEQRIAERQRSTLAEIAPPGLVTSSNGELVSSQQSPGVIREQQRMLGILQHQHQVDIKNKRPYTLASPPQQQQQQQPQPEEQNGATTLNIKPDIIQSADSEEEEESALDDDIGGKNNQSSHFITKSTHNKDSNLENNEEELSLPDKEPSSFSNTDFKHGGNGHNANNPKPKRPTRNQVF